MKKESLIGKKITGFKFKSEEHDGLYYSPYMDKYIGKIGKITNYFEYGNYFKVQFNNDEWCYPAVLVKKYLNITPLIIKKITRTRSGVKYHTWQFSKNEKVSNHQYNSPATRNKQLAQFIEDIKSGNYEIK